MTGFKWISLYKRGRAEASCSRRPGWALKRVGENKCEANRRTLSVTDKNEDFFRGNFNLMQKQLLFRVEQ